MKRLFIIVEGHSEEEFVKNMIVPFFQDSGVYDVRPIKIQTSKGHKGGFVNYHHLKNDALNLLKNQSDIIVTMLVDYFRIPVSIPDYQIAMSQRTALKKVEQLENSIGSDIGDKRFLPYIQLHEFEALLFSSVVGFSSFWYDHPKIISGINQIIKEFPNPEDINDNPITAPSKRLMNIIPEYNKVTYGNLIAMEIGINAIRDRCPRFRNWLDNLILMVN